jgi:hypothetical protein
LASISNVPRTYGYYLQNVGDTDLQYPLSGFALSYATCGESRMKHFGAEIVWLDRFPTVNRYEEVEVSVAQPPPAEIFVTADAYAVERRLPRHLMSA